MMRTGFIGLGYAGSRILAEALYQSSLVRLDTTGMYLAVNSDAADMEAVRAKIPDRNFFLAGSRSSARAHGAGGRPEKGKTIIEENERNLRRRISDLSSAVHGGVDAYIVMASTAGGTGCGGIVPVLRYLKEMNPETPAYALIVLPFADEGKIAKRNTAWLIPQLEQAADAILLYDNNLHRTEGTVGQIYDEINRFIIFPLMPLFAGGEAKSAKDVGVAKVIDSTDIIESWMKTYVTYGFATYERKLTSIFSKVIHRNTALGKSSLDLKDPTAKLISLVNSAATTLSANANLNKAERALLLYSGAKTEFTMEALLAARQNLENLIDQETGEVRSGDFPSEISREIFTMVSFGGLKSQDVPSLDRFRDAEGKMEIKEVSA